MGGGLSKRLNPFKGSGSGGGGAGGSSAGRSGKKVNNNNNHQVNNLQKDEELGKGNYNGYSKDLQGAKSEDVEDAKLKDVMRKQLALDSQVFVVNQLLLGLHFFGNYDV